ncbi:MAG: ferritin family protein [Deltaproteobacteria bacterium]|nr:ferritin family protein [Deltaproteobacteria bacterium]
MILGFNAMEIFEVAIKIEENGRLFYERAGELVENTEIRKLFHDLAGQEQEHKEAFISMKAKLPDSAKKQVAWDPDNETEAYLKMMADINIFKKEATVEEKLEQVKDIKEALKFAIDFEKESILFYVLIKDSIEEDKGREFIDKLIEEEKGHLRILSGELKKYAEC